MKDLKGKAAVITGAGSGLGRGIALHCARQGMKVVLADIAPEPLAETEAGLRAMGAETLAVQADVSDPDNVEELAVQAFEAFGTINLLVNNAGVSQPGTTWECTFEDWNWVMGVNFFGTVHGIRAFVPRMKAQQAPGHIVNVASLFGVLQGPVALYGVSKHAVVALTESLYRELAAKAPHVRVSVYLPGWVRTEIQHGNSVRPARFEKSAGSTPPPLEAKLARALQNGVPVEDAVRILFDGLEKDKLYIGPRAFGKRQPRIFWRILRRALNIIRESNP